MKRSSPSTTTAEVPAAHSPLSNAVTTALRERILAGEAKPGERLIEGRIAEELGMSRIPVREALRALATEGLVEVTPRRSARVAVLSMDVAREMVEVRATLEGLNAQLAARHRDPAILRGIEAVLKAGAKAAKIGNAKALATLNDRFHDLLAEAGNNSVLGELMRTLRKRTSRVFGAQNTRDAQQSWVEHAGILQAVMGGDEELAKLLATRHVMKAGAAALAAFNAAAPVRAATKSSKC